MSVVTCAREDREYGTQRDDKHIAIINHARVCSKYSSFMINAPVRISADIFFREEWKDGEGDFSLFRETLVFAAFNAGNLPRNVNSSSINLSERRSRVIDATHLSRRDAISRNFIRVAARWCCACITCRGTMNQSRPQGNRVVVSRVARGKYRAL